MTRKMKITLLQNGMTQKEIANLMGVAQPHVSAWLNGTRKINSKNLKKMSNALGMPMEELAYELNEIQNNY